MIGAADDVYGSPGAWRVSLYYRNQHSERRFVGSDEEPHPHAAVNDMNVVDLSIGYALTHRYSVDLNLPVVHMNREQSVRAGPTFGSRFDTQARGLGDVSVVARGWVFDPARNERQNVSLGLGVKIPTGKDDVTDSFQTFSAPVEQTVDQSIQPGDGGWGIRVEASAFRALRGSITLFSTVNYLCNPRGTNGVPTFRPRLSESVMSVPDQYLARLGIQFSVRPSWRLGGSLAARIEGVPAHDLFGPSTGFRRPGYALSIEPGLSVSQQANAVFVAVPIAVRRDRVKSVPDEADDPIPQTLGNGDAAFADYVFLLGYSRRF